MHRQVFSCFISLSNIPKKGKLHWCNLIQIPPPLIPHGGQGIKWMVQQEIVFPSEPSWDHQSGGGVGVWTNPIGPTFLQWLVALENPINIKAQFNHDKGGIRNSISDHIATALTGLWMICDSLTAIMMANELPSTPQTKHLEKADWSGPESWVPSVCIS